MSIKVDILWRVYLVFFLMAGFGAAILFQAYRVQNVRPDYWLSKTDSIYLKYRSIDAQRGNIYSSDQRLLATTLPTFDVYMDLNADGLDQTTFRNNVVGLSKKLAAYYPYKTANKWEQELTRAREKGARYHPIRKKVDYRTMLKMKTWPIWERGAYKGGLIIEENKTRKTPFGQLAFRTIGYVKPSGDSVKGVGLESSFHSVLKGVEGKRLEQRVAGGNWVPVSKDYSITPKNGKDIITTIDVNVQDVAESSLERVLKENAAEWGCVIVMEVETGKIKAIANLAKNGSGQYTESYNYAVGYQGEPGSTMKLVTLAALLEDNHVTIKDSVDIHNGNIRLNGRNITDSEGWNPYRNITIKRAFERSSNVAFTSLATRYYHKKPKRFLNKLSDFHFDKEFGVEIQGEKKPFYRAPGEDGWSQMSIASLAFGYEMSMSPLHMLNFYNTVANDGKMMKPYLVEAVEEYGLNIEQYRPTVIDAQMLKPSTVDQLQEVLEGVVQQGTGKNLLSSHYQSAGKTGTTKLFVPGFSYGKYYTASFCGYFPAEQPKYSAIVVINKPQAGRYYGSSVAGPVFKSVADMLYARSLDVQPPSNDSEKDSIQVQYASSPKYLGLLSSSLFNQNIKAEHYSEFEVKDTVAQYHEREMIENLVPNVYNMGLDEAIPMLENSGLRVQYKGMGIVKKQSIQPGVKIIPNQVIQLELGS